ncbi:hypothetical protein HYALB_00012865 [Hymenoscyphus albidus]|uniref:FAD/NAD(P)-binding domain-containing protein n=1 Tax=Hymenoscyphus albidus TaxID=595503 RepID=A0A9N9LVN5_9HELO|nr:hypothetical protein HYALB_00012865 [Hymenoscyphus albidus]
MSESPPNSHSKPIRILIIGAGISGLATALALYHKNQKHPNLASFRITILESTPVLQEIGAGIQILPNSSRYLVEWGLEGMSWEGDIRRGGILNEESVMHVKLGDRHWFIHRANYQQILYHAVLEAGIEILLNHRVRNISSTNGKPTVHFQDGRSMDADLVIGADGIHSETRNFVLGQEIKPLESTCCAYRVTIPASKMEFHPLTAKLLSEKFANLWMNRDEEGNWNEEGDIAELRECYEEWDPTIGALLGLVERVVKWKLGYLPPLERWAGRDGNAVVIGDAAHGMLPHLAQGAAVGLEDGVALAEFLEGVNGVEDIPEKLVAFEGVRKERCEIISKVASLIPRRGEIREKNGIKQLVKNFLRDSEFQTWLYNYDTVMEASLTKKYLDVLSSEKEKGKINEEN